MQIKGSAWTFRNQENQALQQLEASFEHKQDRLFY